MKAIEKNLKSCPFCGGEAVLKVELYYSYVKCKNCGAYTRLVKATSCIRAVDEAVKVWNTRVDEPTAEVKHGCQAWILERAARIYSMFSGAKMGGEEK